VLEGKKDQRQQWQEVIEHGQPLNFILYVGSYIDNLVVVATSPEFTKIMCHPTFIELMSELALKGSVRYVRADYSALLPGLSRVRATLL
jgi:hypothetical protein